jgi:hypothetical protein
MGVFGLKTCWILGAGFSRSLGGPLLTDMFRPRAWGDDPANFPPNEYPHLAEDIYLTRLLFAHGIEQNLWRDAEQFLAYADDAIAAPHPSMRAIITGAFDRLVIPNAPPTLSPDGTPHVNWTLARQRVRTKINSVVRRALAAECSFLREIARDDERLDPYREWRGTWNSPAFVDGSTMPQRQRLGSSIRTRWG